MKRSKFTEAQIVFALRQADNGVKIEEVCRKLGISEATFHNWKKKYGDSGWWSCESSSNLKRKISG